MLNYQYSAFSFFNKFPNNQLLPKPI